VKLGLLRTNKPQTLYSTDSYVVSLAGNSAGTGIVSGHLDGSIYRYYFPSSNMGGSAYTKVCTHPSPPYALSWGKSIAAAGADKQVIFYARDGGVERSFEYGQDDGIGEDGSANAKVKCKEFTVAAFNATGDAVVMGNFDSFYTFSFDKKMDRWEQKEVTVVQNMYTVTALSWRPNGGNLGVGTLCGLVDVWEACVRRERVKGFEVKYVSPSQVREIAEARKKKD